nr:MAG TPA: hypothetical protein [Caudoviricetes sp.]
MHKWAKQIMECVKAKVEAIGLDSFEGQKLDDLKDFTEIAKNIACFDKDYRIVEAMEKLGNDEDIMRMVEQYEDYPDRRFYDHYRYADGRFAPKGKGTYRRGYEEPPYMHMYPEMEHMRDMDRDYGKMYYTEPMSESGYDRAKRNYTETKEMHSGTTPEDKEQRMKALDKYIKTVTNEIIKIVSDNATTEEKSLIKNNMNNLMSKF